MDNKLKDFLLEAAEGSKKEISPGNPYLDLGFDNGKNRLGWVRSNDFGLLEHSLKQISPLLQRKENFVFIGMGGSVNGIKPLLSLFENYSIFTLDSLDPAAIEDIASGITDWEKTLIVPVSKSGTTKETQLLANTFREKLSAELGSSGWKKNFLWLSDIPSFEKLDSLGWQETEKIPIQLDKKEDIGGRFSCPGTLIFALPLFLLANKDLDAIEKIYSRFLSVQEEIRDFALAQALRHKDKDNALFAPLVGKEHSRDFFPWIIQLFQESLGSKLEDFCVKTFPNHTGGGDLSPIGPDLEIDDPVVLLMARMYFFQFFIAFFSAFKKINFVNQDYVEKYKSRMRQLQEKEANIPYINLESLLQKTKEALNSRHRFIEIVLYWHAGKEKIDELSEVFSKNFKDKKNLVCIGSDWNHQSYQAAFGDKYTFYVLLAASSYDSMVKGFSPDQLSENIKVLKLISKATHLTLNEKSFLFSFSR